MHGILPLGLQIWKNLNLLIILSFFVVKSAFTRNKLSVKGFENKLFCIEKSVIALSNGFFHQTKAATEILDSFILFNNCIHSFTKDLNMYLLRIPYTFFCYQI